MGLSSSDILDFFSGTINIVKDQEVGNELLKRALTKGGEINQNINLNGFISENWHELTFNFNARQSHSAYNAKALVPEHGYTKNSVDLVINKNGGKAVKRYQLKYGKDAETTIKMIKKGDYRGQQLLVPAEQVDEVQKAFPNRKVSAIIEVDSVQSDQLSKARALEIQEEMQKGTYKRHQTQRLIKGTAVEMGKAGIIGAVISATTETISLYKDYKNGNISRKEYLIEIAKAGGEGGTTGAATAGIMVPVTFVLSTAGLASVPITIPVSFVLGSAVNKIVAPIFGRGEYKKILGEAQYYQNLMSMQNDLVYALGNAAEQLGYFVEDYQNQLETHETLNRMNAWEISIPDEYLLQIQHYMAVTGYKGTYIAVLIGGNTFKWKFIERDEELISILIKLEADFWDHVKNLTAPELDGSDACAKFLSEKYSDSISNTRIELSETAEGLIQQYQSACEQLDVYKNQKQKAENQLKEMLGNNEIGTFENNIVTWKSMFRDSFDSKTLKAEHPKLYEKYANKISSADFR